MKKLSILAGVAALGVLSAHAAYDGTILIQNGSPQGNNQGGEFLVTVQTGLGQLGGPFDTFCLEKSEYFTPGGTYGVILNSAAVQGGVGSADPLSKGTTWLYKQFRTGGLTYSTGTDAAALQDAIWYLEGEITLAQVSDQKYLNLATGLFGSDAAAKADAPANWMGVVAMNIYSGDFDNKQLAQDMLGMVPEPATVLSGALMLIPLGLTAVRTLRKQR